MRSAAAGVTATARFAFVANLRRSSSITGIVLGIAIVLLGPGVEVASGRPWSYDPAFGFFGFLVTALFVLRSGLEEQRALGLVAFLRYNLVPPWAHTASLLVSLLGAWLAVTALAFLTAAAFGRGDLEAAAWYAAAWGLRALLLVGFVPLVERIADIRLPFLLPVIGYATLMVVASLVLSEEQAIVLFVPVEPGDGEALARLAAQVALVLPPALGLSWLVLGRGPGRRR